MPRYHYAQTDGVSCGAVVCMITLAELGYVPAALINKQTEMDIWTNISGEGGESPPGLLMNFIAGNGGTCVTYEDQTRTNAIMAAAPAFNYPHLKYRTELNSMGYAPVNRAVQQADFAAGARLILTMIIQAPGNAAHNKTHFILARDDGGIHVMNPDTGTDTLEHGFLAWLNGPWGFPRQIGPTNYIYSGIFFRAT